MKLASFFESEWNGDERRTEDRSALDQSLRVMTDHMHQIRRALDNNDIKSARYLVDGAIKAFSKEH